MSSNQDLESMRNEDRIKRLEIELNKLKEKQQIDIDDLDIAIDEDNRLRDSKIENISDNIYLIESFITEKLAPGELEQFIHHISNNRGFPLEPPDMIQDLDMAAVASDDGVSGGRRKKKTRKKKRRKSKKKTKRKY